MPTGTSRLSLDVLDEPRRRAFAALRKLPRGGVLGGGTAIALQLRHRRSYDFDVFYAGRDIPRRWLPLLGRQLGIRVVRPIRDTDSELTVLLEGNVKLSLIAYPFSALHRAIRTTSVPLFDLRDLASSKAYTIGRRGEWRDYVDLDACIERGGVAFSAIIREASQRFHDAFSETLFLQQLTYTGDLTDRAVHWIGRGVSPRVIERRLARNVQAYLNERT